MMSAGDVFAALLGQQQVADELRAAARAAAAVVAGRPAGTLAQAWLFTGPPGSGRSVAARAFAAALQCPDAGCGRCRACRSVLAGSHPDVDLIVPEGLHLTIRDAREIVARAARAPSLGRFQVTVIEDVDRMEERTSNTLLRAIEEPPPRGLFLLCAPSALDLVPTIRSRCRLVRLRLPATESVAAYLTAEEGVDPALAAFAARAAAGHVGRARRLAHDAAARRRRREVLDTVHGLTAVPASLAAAARLVEAAAEEAAAQSAERDGAEAEVLATALGAEPGGRRPRGTAESFRELERAQRSRATRARRDALDRALGDLALFLRDVLAEQLGARDVEANCPDVSDRVRAVAAAGTPETTLRRLEALAAARSAIEANVAPLLAVERVMLELRTG
jgi:DNA polymerase-3 subunit delta'